MESTIVESRKGQSFRFPLLLLLLLLTSTLPVDEGTTPLWTSFSRKRLLFIISLAWYSSLNWENKTVKNISTATNKKRSLILSLLPLLIFLSLEIMIGISKHGLDSVIPGQWATGIPCYFRALTCGLSHWDVLALMNCAFFGRT